MKIINLNVYKKKLFNIRGNYRLKSGMYRTKKEQEEYKRKSLERKLP